MRKRGILTRYKIIYYQGDKIELKTRTKSGMLKLNESKLTIQGADNYLISFNRIESAELFRHYGLGRMIKIRFENKTLFVTVVRFSLFNFFAVVNFFKTGQLFKEINTKLTKR